MKSAGKARNNGLYRHIRTSKEIIRNLLNDSTEQFLNKVRYVYSSALNEYLNLVELIFPSVKEYLMIWKLSPCKIVGGLVFHEDSIHFKDAPMLTWYIEALPLPEKNCVDIELKKIPFNDIELFKNLSSNNSNIRHLLRCTPATSFSSEFLDICNSTPVTNLVYEWLKNDLTRIGWLSI